MADYKKENKELLRLNGPTWKNPLYTAFAFACNGEIPADPHMLRHIVVDYYGAVRIMQLCGVSYSVNKGLAFYKNCTIVGISVYNIPSNCSNVQALATVAANPIIAQITKCIKDGTFSRCIHPPQPITTLVSPIVEAHYPPRFPLVSPLVEADFDGENSNIRKSASVTHSSPTEKMREELRRNLCKNNK